MGTIVEQSAVSRNLEDLFPLIEEIYQIQDLDTLLEEVLRKARTFLKADAGTLYLKSRKKLFFSYIQNDTLFNTDRAESRYVYSSRSLPLNRSSLAGYAAMTGEGILVDDVYDIKSGVDYSFNPDFDKKSSYRTKSMLIVPLKTSGGKVVGVLQLINAKDDDGSVVSFSRDDLLHINHFAQHAAAAIEQSRLNREMVLRMVELTELRDPFESSQHAKRVGASSVELFEKWALQKSQPRNKINKIREMLRTAAILHDIGKIAISDTILKKTGELDDAEVRHVRTHPILGSRLFRHQESEWDNLTAQVVLNHHERWDGKGYPGKFKTMANGDIVFGPGKKGKEIPWAARIVAITDVYDALLSKRAYKEAWSKEDVLQYLHVNAGKQFDPEMLEVFFGIQNIMDSIRKKYSY
jgi:HD-GYP domain-containing protein (c-di-GMP phosphodiesterase class II)